MAITYPITLPATPAIAGIEFVPGNTVGVSRSPWTGQTQVQRWAAELWGARVALPPMSRANAAAWIASLQSLRGPWGTMYLGPQDYTPRGSAGRLHNLQLYSEQLDNAVWNKSNITVTPNATTAPDAATTADLVVETTATGTHWILDQHTAEASTTYTWSIHAKAAGRTAFIIQIGTGFAGTAQGVLYDLSTGQSSIYLGQGNPQHGMVALGNGWYRCWLTATSAAMPALASFTQYIYNGATPNYTGDGVSGLYFWGAQLEKNAAPGDYLPTTDTVVGIPVVDGAQIAGDTLASRGWAPNAAGVLMPDDYIQVGSQLFQVLTEADADANGESTLDIWPAIRTSLADGALVETDTPQGVFRLAGDAPSWQHEPGGIIASRTFEVIEAL